MNKKNIIPFIFAIGAMVAFLIITNKSAPKNPEQNVIENPTPVQVAKIPDGKYCYQYSQKATFEAPYAVEEYVQLSITQGVVSGLKIGSQSGPDLSGGYDGTISGTIGDDNNIVAIFAHTVEGSKGQEQEEYTISPELLVKHRYTLKEDGPLLVPNKDTFLRDMMYPKVECREAL
ncbi:MAG: hypothetical protein KBC42_00500 [Candidatus Pacebacteria bacterium]|nr:hypothetical protein [Candidatus Paceibacterota bacterium]MBP9780387.1 hypothetical protein [Candidatus Paceibacterota bacterium]